MGMLNWAATREQIFLRIFRWKIQMRYIPPLRIAIPSSLVFIALSVFAWKYFGTEVCLPILADGTPILLTIVGIVMSYIQPKKESHQITTIVLVVAGLVGSTILSMNRVASDNLHRTEVKSLNDKIVVVQTQNTSILTSLTSGNLGGQKITEPERRQNIEKVLRNEYILSHNPIDTDIVAGTKMPPEEWMNKRLRQLHETWSVAQSPDYRQPLPAPSVTIEPSYGDLAKTSNQLYDDIMSDLYSYGWSGWSEWFPSQRNRPLIIKPMPDGKDRQALENWHWDVSEKFRLVYLKRVIAIRDRFATLQFVDEDLDSELREIKETEKDPVFRMIQPGEIQQIAERLKVLAAKIPRQP